MSPSSSSGRRAGAAAAACVALLLALVAGCKPIGESSGDTATTIAVGYVNRESASGGLPEWRYGGLAAIDYINAHGGIGGVKIKPIVCLTDASPEASINCANQFVDKGVALEFMGLDVGSDAALPILKSAGIPFVATVAAGTVQLSDPDSFMFGGLGPDAASLVQALKDSGAKRVTIVIYAGLPAQKATAATVKSMGARAGLQVATLEVPASNADWTASVASALTSRPDGFLLATRENDCTNMLRALKAAKYKGVTAAVGCTEYLKTLGKDAPRTLAGVQAWTPDLRRYAPAEVMPRLDVYQSAMKAIGHADLADTAGASRTFSGWMQLAEILRGIHGPVDAASVKKALQGAADVPGYLGPDLHCGRKVWPSQPSVCSAQEMLLRIVPGPTGLRREPMSKGFTDLSALAS
ncbi:ABC transporter substrate-binding protein [Actinomadura montaniterrae]|uniref:ABC transporter substrate-binding protein n=1 Tax=Actinomadura montaniterrae TaxID=1803903 RepID=UPI00178C4B5C|nr:ABC transporter substrate-binding protein [Actinomadura montaniterrae]